MTTNPSIQVRTPRQQSSLAARALAHNAMMLTTAAVQGSSFANDERTRTIAAWAWDDVHAATLQSATCKDSLAMLLAQARRSVPANGSKSPAQWAEAALQAASPDGVVPAACRILLGRLA